MSNKIFSLALCAMVLALYFPVQAQQRTKIPRIGYLDVVNLSSNSARTEAFRQGLRELGYVEGKNIVIEWRSGEGKRDRLPALAAELVHLKVDVIVTGGALTTSAAKKATSTIPIRWPRSDNPKSAIQKRPRRRKLVGLATLVIAFAICGDVRAQPTNIPRIGYASAGSRGGNN